MTFAHLFRWSGVGACVVLLGGCGAATLSTQPEADNNAPASSAVVSAPVKEGFVLRLSSETASAPEKPQASVVDTKELPAASRAALLKRAKELPAAEPAPFSLREGPRPPPSSGKKVLAPFPPPATDVAVPAPGREALTVLRWAPEGNVPLAPVLSLTFSQPMVSLSGQKEASESVPVRLSPRPPGNFRWLGTQTLLFEPTGRFPHSTTFSVEVPAGTQSALGGTLKQAHRFQFTTPPLEWVEHLPDGQVPQPTEPLFLLRFNQEVDASKLLPWVEVSSGARTYPLRQLKPDELPARSELATKVAQLEKENLGRRLLLFRSVEPLPKGSTVRVVLKKGAPSAEGPNTPSKAQEYAFRTYEPLQLLEAGCGYLGECRPGMPFFFRFNNPLDEDAFDESWVTVTPALPEWKVQLQDSALYLSGLTTAHTEYEIGVSEQLIDRFQQRLSGPLKRKVAVGASLPSFDAPSGMVVLDASGKTPTYPVLSSGHGALRVRLWKVKPQDYPAFEAARQNLWRTQVPGFPGEKVLEKTLTMPGDVEALHETAVDLKEGLVDGVGNVIVWVEPHPWREKYPAPKGVAWVQVTRLSIDASIDRDRMHLSVSTLANGAPVENASLRFSSGQDVSSTDRFGQAVIKLPEASRRNELLVVSQGQDSAFLPFEELGAKQEKESLRWYVVDDRRLYRPGETVSLKGWIRRIVPPMGDLRGVDGRVTQLKWTVRDATLNELGKGEVRVSERGGFDLRFSLPQTLNLGTATVRLEAQGPVSGEHLHAFEVQEFRRPEFEVKTEVSEGPHLVGESAQVDVHARYFAQGALPNAPVRWEVTASETRFVPPNQSDYTFGRWQPFWRWGPERPSREEAWTSEAQTDIQGAHRLRLDFDSAEPALPYSLTASATVKDVNRQAWNSSTTFLVHPAQTYVGLKAERAFVEKGQPMVISVLGVDLEGQPRAGRRVQVEAALLDWVLKKGRYTEVEKALETCERPSQKTAFTCSFQTPQQGRYRLRARIWDEKNRSNLTEMEVWVSGGKSPPSREVEQGRVQLLPDKQEYAPGDKARILVQAPFAPAYGVMSLRRKGILKTEPLSLPEGSTTLLVDVEEAHLPAVKVVVELSGSTPPGAATGLPAEAPGPRPAFAHGELRLPVSTASRELLVEVRPASSRVSPGEETRIEVQVKQPGGRPAVAAEVAVFVVDEAVLAMAGYVHPHPLPAFYPEPVTEVWDRFFRRWLVSTKVPRHGTLGRLMERGVRSEEMGLSPVPMAMAKMSMGPQALAADKSGPAFVVRSDFNPLAAFSPTLLTDAQGRATLPVQMPDNVTRYRVVALAALGEKSFGKGESTLSARLPLMVRPSAPRFLNFGDVFELPVVLQNQTDQPMSVQLAARAQNLGFVAAPGLAFTVPAQDRVEVRLPMKALHAGTAHIQLLAEGTFGSRKAQDAARVTLPVWTPATTEAFATYGTLEDGAMVQPLSPPTDIFPDFGGLDVETSSTQLQALTDAFLYLFHSPYECSEQLASRILSIAALREVLQAFEVAELPNEKSISERIGKDLAVLASMQNADGGMPFWQKGQVAGPYHTVHVGHALVRARASGYRIDDGTLSRLLTYLKTIEQHLPPSFGPDIRRTLVSYALYVRRLSGEPVLEKARSLLKESGGPEKLSMEAVGWLLGVMAKEPKAQAERTALLRHLYNRVSETAGAAHFTPFAREGAHLLLGSDRRVDGIVLEALLRESPGSDLIPKLVRGLLAHRKKGRWSNTQENVFVLLALDAYFQAYEKRPPSFVARAWLGEKTALEHRFSGRQADVHSVRVPMAEVSALPAGRGALTLQKEGTGRLYYRLAMRYAPKSLALSPLEAGFTVTRRYEGVEAKEDVELGADGRWKIRAGALVRVKLSMVAPSRRYHVALVDALPAGLEALNPALGATPPEAMEARPPFDFSRSWFDHQNLRDERVEAFSALLWEGVYEYSYIARATTPGTFVVPPTRAEEMYAPETFGRSGSDVVVIEALGR